MIFQIENQSARALIVLALAIFALLVAFWPLHAVGFWGAVFSYGTIFIGLIPGTLLLVQPAAQRRPIPLMALCGSFYAVFFGAPAFWAGVLRDQPARGVRVYGEVFVTEVPVEAAVLLFGGILLMYGGWLAARRFGRVPRLRLGSMGEAPSGLVWLYWGLALGNLAYIHVPWINALPSIGQLLMPAGLLAFGGFLALWLTQRLSFVHGAAYFLLAFPMMVLKVLSFGFLTPLLLLATYGFAIVFWLRGRFPIKSICALVLLAAALYPVQAKVRGILWQATPDVGVLAKAADIGGVLAGSFGSWQRYKQILLEENGLSGLARRTSLVLPFAHVVTSTPERVPYWGGETYRPIFTSSIPRVLWPDKPEERAGGAFGKRYGMLAPEDGQMSINLPWVTEMYANFGSLGVLIGMLMVGGLLGMLERIFNSPQATIAEGVMGSALLMPVFYQESNFSLIMGSFILLAFCYWLYFRVGLWALSVNTQKGKGQARI